MSQVDEPAEAAERRGSSAYFDRGPPPPEAAARMARYIVHNSDWASMATLSTRDPIAGYPFASVFSVSDGSDVKESSGIPYLYMTPLDMSVKDLEVRLGLGALIEVARG